MLVSNHFHSVKNFFFRLPNHVILMECQALDFRCQCTQRKLQLISGVLTLLKFFFTLSVKDGYQLNYFICIKDFNAQTITSLKLNLLYFFIYCCHHHERQTTCIDIFLLSDREWGPNTSIYSEEIVNLRIGLSESPIHLEKMKKNKKKLVNGISNYMSKLIK